MKVASMTAIAINQGFLVPVADLCSAEVIVLCAAGIFRKGTGKMLGQPARFISSWKIEP